MNYNDKQIESLISELNEKFSLIDQSLVSQKSFLSIKEACSYLSISKSKLYKMTANREIDFYKPNNGKIFFKTEQLDAWIESSRVKVDEKAIQTSNSEINDFLSNLNKKRA